jgi:hypothetical protein
MESKEQTIVKLRERLGREPTEVEINEARNALIRQRYADMALTAVLFENEYELPTQSVRERYRGVSDVRHRDETNIRSFKNERRDDHRGCGA